MYNNRKFVADKYTELSMPLTLPSATYKSLYNRHPKFETFLVAPFTSGPSAVPSDHSYNLAHKLPMLQAWHGEIQAG